MRRTRLNATRVLCGVFVLVVLCGSAAARDPNETASVDKSDSASELMERTMHPEIWCLRGLQGPSPRGELARKVVQRWDNGVVDPEPALAEARLKRGRLDEYTGRMVYDSLFDATTTSGTAPAALSLLVVDEDDDLLGIHVREKYVLPNGVESSFEETYPVFVTRREKSFLGSTVIPVYLRCGNHVKDEARWQAYVDEVNRDARSQKIAQPEIWITEPDPNAVAVSISVYDRKGHESNILPVRLVLPDPDAGSRWEDKQALKSYKEQGTEVARWPDEAIVPRPGNAALLYYRAIACQPASDPCTARIVNLMGYGQEPDDRVRTYLGRCLDTIHLMQLASQIPQCSWGLLSDPAWEHTTTTIASLQRLRNLQTTHAQTLAADGQYRAALENCLVNLRFARHIGDDRYILFCVSHTTDYAAMRGVLDVLTTVPPDEQTLRWLRDQFMTVEGTPLRPAAAFGKWCDREVAAWQLYDGARPFERQWALAQIRDEAEKAEATKLTDGQLLIRLLCQQRSRRDCQYGLAVPDGLLAQARKQFDEFVAAAVRIMESELPYKDKQTRLEALEGEFYDRGKRCEPLALLQFAPTAVATYHQFAVRETAMFNCATVAVELLLVETETGQLPAAIPERLPKDPFTGKDFGYERTGSGFILRFDPERVSELRLRDFKFGRSSPQRSETSG